MYLKFDILSYKHIGLSIYENVWTKKLSCGEVINKQDTYVLHKPLSYTIILFCRGDTKMSPINEFRNILYFELCK